MSRGRPSKPVALHLAEGNKRKLTKAEIQLREEEESRLLTGVSLKESEEVKENQYAHKEFLRLKNLLKKIGKDDDLNGHVINAHCMLVAECKSLEILRERYTKNLFDFEQRVGVEEITFTEEMQLLTKIQKAILDIDKALMGKRKMLLDIAKENLLTIQSALRSVQKQPDKPKENPMANFLKRKQGG